HQTGGDDASVDACAESQDVQKRQERLATGGALTILDFVQRICAAPLLVQMIDGALGIDGGADAGERMPLIRRRCTPERHNAVTDIFIESAIVFFDDIGDEAEIDVDGMNNHLSLLIEEGL